MAAFPTDVITDILRVLPVKALTRFKCVSKSWDSLIKDPHFVKLHLHHSFKTNNNIKLVLDSRTDVVDDDDEDDYDYEDEDEDDDDGDGNCDGDDEAYSVDFDSLGNLEQLPRPFPTAGAEFISRIFGSCNGLLAVYHKEAGIALWNPSTRTCHYLPKLTIGDVIERDYYIIGFGYDVIGDDYKVVRMIDSGKSVMVYSLKTDSWKRIRDCPYQIPSGEIQDGAYAYGSLHWVGDERDKYFGGRLIFGLMGLKGWLKILPFEVRDRVLVFRLEGRTSTGVVAVVLLGVALDHTNFVEDSVGAPGPEADNSMALLDYSGTVALVSDDFSPMVCEDMSWFPDSGATAHLTPDAVGDGSLSSNSRSLVLNNLLHVPSIKKNLLSVSQFTRDNHVSIEFYPNSCVVKDLQTRQEMLRGVKSRGLYKLPSSRLVYNDSGGSGSEDVVSKHCCFVSTVLGDCRLESDECESNIVHDGSVLDAGFKAKDEGVSSEQFVVSKLWNHAALQRPGVVSFAVSRAEQQPISSQPAVSSAVGQPPIPTPLQSTIPSAVDRQQTPHNDS
ncbi:hypothetical protein GQ457_09G014840 [Hibiscus cannabinus]